MNRCSVYRRESRHLGKKARIVSYTALNMRGITVSDNPDDIGIIEVVIERLEKQRLPRLLALKDKVDNGESLDDYELEFLEHSIVDARDLIPVTDRNPEYQPLAAKVIELHKEISDKALQNG